MAASANDPSAFSDEELEALLRDESVAPASIASEMEDAGVEPLPVEALAAARQVLLDPAEAQSEAVAALPPRLLALAFDAAVQAGTTGLVTELCGHRDKQVVKLAKRALHALRSRGVSVAAPRPAPAAPPPRQAEELPAYISSADGYGERVVFLPTAVRGGVDLAQIVVSDVEGLVSAHLAPLGRKEYRRFVEGLSRASGVLVGEVPRAYARGLVSAGLDRNARVGRAIPPEYNQIALRLGARVEPSPSPGRQLPLPEDESGLRAQGGQLLDLPELRSWIPEEKVLRELNLRLDETAVSPLYIDDQQREASVKGLIQRTVGEYWSAGRRALAAERLYDLAWLLQGANRTEDARMVLATARGLESDAPVEALPFCYTLFERVVGLMQKKSGGPPPRTAPRGLIVPG